jgi:hypothetical protein
MQTFMQIFFSQFNMVLFVLAVIIILFQIKTHRKRYPLEEIVYRWITLLPVGVLGLYTFVVHAFFPEYSAAAIGWQTSPFQFEVAIADLGFGLIAVLAFRASYGFRLASVIGVSCWLWGDAVGHIYQMIHHHNFASGNAGSWFWLDVILPFILIICIIKLRHHKKLG